MTRINKNGLWKHQNKFMGDVAKLIDFIQSKGCMLSGGELYRTKFQQAEHMRRGRSKTMNSYHLKRLAIDLNIAKPHKGGYVLVHLKDELQVFGDYWESLDKNNKWGGNFTGGWDTPHFERNDRV